MVNPLSLPTDNNNEIVQGLFTYPLGTASRVVANTTSANSMILDGSIRAVSITSDQPIFFEYKVGSIPAANTASHYLPSNTRDLVYLGESNLTNTCFAFLGVTVTANVYVSPRV
mgnify:CR=1 FL=1